MLHEVRAFGGAVTRRDGTPDATPPAKDLPGTPRQALAEAQAILRRLLGQRDTMAQDPSGIVVVVVTAQLAGRGHRNRAGPR